MTFCRDCNVLMQPVMSFSKDKHEKFDRCPKCFGETKHRKLRDDDLDFGEVLDKEIHKTKQYIKVGKSNGSNNKLILQQ